MDETMPALPSFAMKQVIVDTYIQFLPALLEASPQSTILDYLETQGVIRKVPAVV